MKLLTTLMIIALSSTIQANTTPTSCNIPFNKMMEVRYDIKMLQDDYNKGIHAVSDSDSKKTINALRQLNQELSDTYVNCQKSRGK